MDIYDYLKEVVNSDLNCCSDQLAYATTTQNTLKSLFESGCVIYLSEWDGGKTLFSYSKNNPPKMVVMTKIGKEEAFKLLNPDTTMVESEGYEDNADVTITEISPRQIDIMKAISKGEQTQPDGDVSWLVDAGMIERSPAGNYQLTPFAVQWIREN